MSFNAGDLVYARSRREGATHFYDDGEYGGLGVVLPNTGYGCSVMFLKKFSNGHDCRRTCASGHGWNFSSDEGEIEQYFFLVPIRGLMRDLKSAVINHVANHGATNSSELNEFTRHMSPQHAEKVYEYFSRYQQSVGNSLLDEDFGRLVSLVSPNETRGARMFQDYIPFPFGQGLSPQPRQEIILEKRYHINNYNYRPSEFTKYGNSTTGKYYGLEIEMDCGGENNDRCNDILQIINKSNEIAYAVHDGSLDDGFEIVLQPMTLGFLSGNKDLKEGLERAISLGYRGDIETCGLHIHIDREAFGADADQQEVNIGKLIFLFERFWGEIIGLSRRRDTSRVERYAKRYSYKYNSENENSNHTFEDILKNNKNQLENYCDRYFAVNLQNSKTVEIRIFKGTLNYNSIIAITQFVNKMVVVSNYTIEKIRRMSFYSIISPLLKKEEFAQYFANVVEKGHLKAFNDLENAL